MVPSAGLGKHHSAAVILRVGGAGIDQMQIRVGDCVVVEEGKSSANIRREPEAVCGIEDPEVWAEVEDEFLEEAAECQEAKDRLLAAIRDVVGDLDDAQDVYQEAMLDAYRGVRRFRGDSHIGTWLFALAVGAVPFPAWLALALAAAAV